MIYVVKNNTGYAKKYRRVLITYRIFEAEYFQKFLCGKKNHTGNHLQLRSSAKKSVKIPTKILCSKTLLFKL